MDKYKRIAILFAVLLTTLSAFAQNQEESVNYMEMAAKQTEEFIKLYKLDEAQAFKVDTLLQRVYPAMMSEIETAKKGGASNYETFQAIQDRYANHIDNVLSEIFTPAQWKKYLKTAAGKEKTKREKRISDAEQAKKIE